LNKDTIFLLIDKTLEMEKSRELNNKLRGSLFNIHTYDFSLDDFMKFLNKLSEGKKSRIDVKLVQ
jgi:hypothetical protein